jgi:hypothetical protein
MKEMAKPQGVYAKCLPPEQHEPEREAFFRDMNRVIHGCGSVGFWSLIRLADLARFNCETGLDLKPYPRRWCKA